MSTLILTQCAPPPPPLENPGIDTHYLCKEARHKSSLIFWSPAQIIPLNQFLISAHLPRTHRNIRLEKMFAQTPNKNKFRLLTTNTAPTKPLELRIKVLIFSSLWWSTPFLLNSRWLTQNRAKLESLRCFCGEFQKTQLLTQIPEYWKHLQQYK